MDKGIRKKVQELFVSYQHLRAEQSDKIFRKSVIEDTAKQLNVTIASSSAAYNFVLKALREENSPLVLNLGRPAGYKGGNTKENRRLKGLDV